MVSGRGTGGPFRAVSSCKRAWYMVSPIFEPTTWTESSPKQPTPHSSASCCNEIRLANLVMTSPRGLLILSSQPGFFEKHSGSSDAGMASAPCMTKNGWAMISSGDGRSNASVLSIEVTRSFASSGKSLWLLTGHAYSRLLTLR